MAVIVRFLTVGLFALLMRGGILALLVFGWHMSPMLAIFPAVAVTAAINYLGTAFYVFPVKQDPPTVDALAGRFTRYCRLYHTATPDLPGTSAADSGRGVLLELRPAHGSEFLRSSSMVAWLIWLGTAPSAIRVRRSHRRIHLRPYNNGLPVRAGTQPV